MEYIPAPTLPNFTANNTYGFTNLAVQFTDTSTGSPTNWSWDFGDIGAGNTSTLQNPTHTYTAAGTYTVNLTVNNTANPDRNITKFSYVTALAAGFPTPIFSANTTMTQVGSPVNFTQTSQGTTPMTTNWSFGDGTYSTTDNVSHTYTSAGLKTVSLNNTNSVGTNTTTLVNYINVGGAGFTEQDIWMTQQYLLTLHVADAATGSAIASATWTDSTTQAITTTTNGTFYLTYPYGSLAGVVSATGYNSKVFSMVIDNDTTQTVQLTTATANPNQNTWYSPHQVRFEIHNDYGNRLDGVSVSARAVGTTLPDEQVRTVYGINPDAANQMLNFTLLMNGTTGSDGAIVYTMLGSITYVMNMTNPADGTAFSTTVMPVDSQYILRMSSGSPLQNFSNASNVYNVLANTSLTFSEPNSSYVTMGLTYQDTTGTTTSLHFYVMAANNRTVMYTSNLGNPGRNVVYANWTVANQRGQQYIWNYTALRST